MAKGLDEQIPNIGTAWSGYAGKRVEEYIKKLFGTKVGYLYRPQEKGTDNNYHLYGFADEDSFNDWNSDPDNNADLVLTDIALPESGGSGSTAVSYIVGLYRDGSGDIVTTDNTVKVKIRFTSEEYNPLTQTTESTSESGTLTVQRRLNSSASWTTVGTIENIPSIPSANTDEWYDVDITNMLGSGTQQVRLIVKGEITELNTRTIQFNVTKTTLNLNFATQWERPITDGVMRLSYYISGAVSKTLNIVIDGQTSRKIERNIGTSVYTETPLQIDVSDAATDSVKLLTHGIHEIEAWTSVNNSTIESTHLHSQVMVVADSADTTTYLILNDVKSQLTNWTSEQILTYAVYNPTGATTPLKFVLSDYSGNDHYMTLDVGNVTSETRYTLTNVIEIDSTLESIDAYMRFYSGDSEIHTVLGFEVDNSENFSPTANPDFVLNPRSRTNDETNPQTIVNAATDEVVPSTWSGFGLKTDGWIEDSSNQRCLRVPSGHTLDIDYEAFTGFIGSDNRSSLTIEFDFATRNATKTDTPVLRMCSYDGDYPLGFELKPWQAVFMTEGKRVRDDQDVMIYEDKRTHIALNIIYGINGTSQNYVRIFVNGIINREFEWTASDTFVQYVNGVRTSQGIRIGSEYCDIDIYGLRIYKRSLSATNIRQDYMASLPTSEEKIKFREANDILDDSNLISYAKTSAKYNTIVVTGTVPSYSTGNIKTATDWEINIVGDPAHSGTLNNVTTSGQGTSSRSYWLWNLQAKPNDDTDWVDGNGVHHGPYYQLDDTVPLASKLVAKLNWASSQQSHKLGSCNLYTDLWRKCTGGSSITNTAGFENCRVTVKQKPFFLFVRSSAEEEPVFYGLYTFGPGKGDKPTFGYDKSVFPDYLMIEGCDNGEPLTNHRVPWNDDVTIGGDEDELIMYNGSKQWEIDMGNSDSLSYFKDAFNFIYLCSPHILPFVGTLAQLQADTTVDKQKFYWVTQATGTTSAKFDLYRYDNITGQWVDAGVAKQGTGKYATLNLSSQLSISPSGNVWDDINQQFINARVQKFVREASSYFKLDDAFYHQMFIKLIGASDNRAKNTYMYLATHDGGLKIHFAQDDLDTIFLTDNVGRKNKPYYVEEHDYDEDGGPYWNGENNALYCLFELGFPSELRAMMNKMLTEMANMASDNTLFGCMEDYYFFVQKYFPAVAYNEAARLLYETASAKWATGEYTAAVHPIAQSLGDQLQGEMQWVKLRLIYLSSFASYGQFKQNGEGSLQFRSAYTKAGANPTYSFELTPHMWLYPAVSAGSSTLYGRGNAYPQRVEAGQTFTLDGVAGDDDTTIQIHGVHYMTSVGEFGDKSLSGDFTVMGDRLVEFHASDQSMEFRPTSITVTAPNLRVFNINGASTIVGSVDFSLQTRLEEVDLRGTSLSSFTISEPAMITSLGLPATLTRLELDGYESLEADNFEIEGVSAIQSFKFADCPNLSSQSIVAGICATANNVLSECKVDSVQWTRFSLEHMMKLADIKADLTGSIYLTEDNDNAPTFDNKIQLLDTYGDIDTEDNKLYIHYKKIYLTSIEITGDTYFSEPGTYQLQVTPNSTRANDFKKIEWSISSNSCKATINSVTGELTLPQVGTEAEHPEATVTCKATLSDGTTLTATATLGFYFRKCKVGDLVFHDGTYSDKTNKNKVVVGVCFYIDPADESRRLMAATSELSTGIQWGLYQNSGMSEADQETYCLPGIELADTDGYNVYDTPVTNITSSGLTDNTLSDANYRDEYSDDGFVEFGDSVSAGDIGFMRLTRDFTFLGTTYESGTYMPRGLYKTLQIIQHRNTILQDSGVALEVPYASDGESELTCLNRLMSELVTANDGLAKWRQFYYPAASLCHAYEPSVRTGLTLDSRFKAGNWFLPANGDLLRACYYHLQNSVEDSELAIFQKWVEAGIFNTWRSASYWSSTEYSQYVAWNVFFSSGYTGNYSKDNSISVRAVAAF